MVSSHVIQSNTDQSISLVLCTYNSTKYIVQQLDSILNQTRRPNEIIISDDASNDDTIDRVSRILKGSAIPHKILINKETVGFVKNFEAAIKATTGTYITLCDHDDVWLPNKNEELLKAIMGIEKQNGSIIPALSFCDSSLTNENMEIYEKSFIKSSRVNVNRMLRNKYSLCIQNIVTGMCCMFNRKLMEIALPMPENVAVHDWWLALIAHREGKIVYVDKQLVLYRQHGFNCLGAGQDVGLSWPSQILGILKLDSREIKRNLKNRAIMYRNSYQIRIPHLLALYERTADNNYKEIALYLDNGGARKLFNILKLSAAPLPHRARLYFSMMFIAYSFISK